MKHVGTTGVVTGGQRAQPAPDQAWLGELVSTKFNRDFPNAGSIVFTSLGTGEQTLQITGETKIMRNGYASNLKYAQSGDIASVILREKGPFVKNLNLTSKPTAGSATPLDPKKAAAQKNAASDRLLKWHSDQAAKGDPRGLYEMGKHYELGDCVETNKTKAVDFYTKAAAGGSEEAKLALKKINSGTP